MLRFWEKEFREIKPILINNRRHYNERQIEVIRLIKFLLKDKGMTIKGVKNVLKNDINCLDDYNSNSLKTEYQKKEYCIKKQKSFRKNKNFKRLWQKKHIKVRLVPENNPDSKFIYYAKNLQKVKKQKIS